MINGCREGRKHRDEHLARRLGRLSGVFAVSAPSIIDVDKSNGALVIF